MKELDRFDVELGKILRSLRNKKKMSAEEVAKRIGITHQMVSLYELGKSAMTVTMLRKFCEIYGVMYYDIVRQAGENEKVS